ncbi:hypothetical protein J4455_02115 [Candidatus Woesearchaeota archaeon]|nr:hypothetical protein [Candidatus Woesearchaeota archaeon]
MKTDFVTLFQQPSSKIQKLKAGIDVTVWEYDETTGISNPHVRRLTLEQRVPTSLSRNPDLQTLTESTEKYKTALIDIYKTKLDRINEQIKSARPGTKLRAKLDEEKIIIEEFLSNINRLIRLEGPFSNGNYQAFHLVSPFIEHQLSDIFLCSEFVKNRYLNNTRQTAIALNFPFGIINESNEPTGARISLETLLEAKSLAIDFETHNWRSIQIKDELRREPLELLRKRFLELVSQHNISFDSRRLEWMDIEDYVKEISDLINLTKDERITVAALINLRDNENYVVTTFNPDHDSIMVRIPGRIEDREVRIVKASNQFSLIQKVNRLIQQINPLFMYGHNQMGFDYQTAERLTRNFRAGVNEKKPLQKAQAAAGFITQRILPGRIDIDPSLYALNYLDCYNNRLDTVFENVIGIKSAKSLTQEQLEIKTRNAEAGNQHDIDDVLSYSAQDAMKSFLLGERLKLEHLILSTIHYSLPARIDSTGRKTIGEDYWVNWWYKHKKTFPSREIIKSVATITTNGEDRQVRYEEFRPIDILQSELKRIPVQKGIHEGKLIAVFPFADAFNQLLSRDPNVDSLYKRLQETSDPKEKIRILKSIDSLLEYPLFMLLDKATSETKFAASFMLGFSGLEKEKYLRITDKNLEMIIHLAQPAQIINSCREYLVLQPSVDLQILNQLTQSNIAIYLGDGRFLSGSRGRYAGIINDEFIMFGIADFHSNKGFRCDFERNFYEYFLRQTLISGDPKSALLYLVGRAKQLSQGTISQDELKFDRTARRDHTDYSAQARQSYIRDMAEQKTKKGDIVRPRRTVQELQYKFFGITPKAEDQYGLFEDTSTITAETTKVGTISEVVEWLFIPKTIKEVRPILEKLYHGKGRVEDVDAILSHT